MINVISSENARLKGGPKVFMNRLRDTLIVKGKYSDSNFTTWINLSFKKKPKFVKNDVKYIVRWDGIYNTEVLSSKYSFLLFIRRIINYLLFIYMNRVLFFNYYSADKIIFQSLYSKLLLENTLLKSKITKEYCIILNGVDLNSFYPVYVNDENKIRIVVSHRMTPLKRFYDIPEIISKLIQRFPNVEVNVLGSGIKNPFKGFEDSMDFFKRKVSKFNLDQYFNFIGHIEPSELASFYRSNDMMLNLSFADPCPNVVVEAVASGLPIIAPNSGGIPEIIGFSDTLINEDIDPFKLYPWDYNDVPKPVVDDYVEMILSVKSNLLNYKRRFRNAAESRLDINKIIDDYIDFCEK